MPSTTPHRGNIPITNEIKSFMHCGLCIHESLGSGKSPREYANYEIGFTPIGLQVWCKRHECNVIHLDFQGMTPLANSHADVDHIPEDKRPPGYGRRPG